MTKLRLLSWNTAKRLKRAAAQVDFIQKFDADIIALQEVIPSTEERYRILLRGDYTHITSSFELVTEPHLLTKKRMFGQLLASKFPLRVMDPVEMPIPWTERVLSCEITLNDKNIKLHTAHVPPGSSNGWIKIDTINGIVSYLASKSNESHILCGDFNTPQLETADSRLVTFGQKLTSSGKIKTLTKFRGGLGADWDAGERALFEQLPLYRIVDSFRVRNPTDFDAYSWSYSRQGKVFKRRFDHFFASDDLTVLNCRYCNTQGNLSDHAPMIVEYRI